MAHGACQSCGAAFEDCECTPSSGVSSGRVTMADVCGVSAPEGVSPTGRLPRPFQNPLRHEPTSSVPIFVDVDWAALELRAAAIRAELPFPEADGPLPRKDGGHFFSVRNGLTTCPICGTTGTGICEALDVEMIERIRALLVW